MENWASYALPQDAENPILMASYDQMDVAENSTFGNVNGVPELLNWTTTMNFDGFMEGSRGGGTSSSSRSHSEAEKRRRDRINAQLATLRKFIPNSDKMDKAALLASVVAHVKDLKKKAMDINKLTLLPSDVDEVTVNYVNDDGMNNKGIFLKVSISCDDDRPELFSELNQGLKNLRLTIVHADMVTLGGRVRCIFLLHAQESDGGGKVCMDSLKVVLSRIVTSCSTSNFRVKSRRQRFFFPTH